jgi:GNAT superfamily N-acetyltransferase
MTARDVVDLPDAQLEGAARVLGRAFQDDPLMCYSMPDPELRARALPVHLAGLLRFGRLFGAVHVTAGDVAGAAIWQSPDADVTPERFRQADLDSGWRAMGQDAAMRLGEVMDALQPVNERDVSGEHWYLMLVGVDPDEQSKGLGRALLEPGMRSAEQAGLPCYLVSFNERNLPFYERLGFERATTDVEPKSGLDFWTFLREPSG